MSRASTVFLLLFIGLALVLGSRALAQEPGGDPPDPKPKEEGKKPDEGGEKGPKKPPKPDIDAERKRAREYAKHPDQRVEVILKRGTVFEGIARLGVLAEEMRQIEVKGQKRREQIFAPIHWKKVLKPGMKDGKRILTPFEPRVVEGVKPEFNWNKVGIRIWFFRQTKGYIFLSYRDVKLLQVIRVLSYRESKKMFQAVEDQEKKLLDAEKKARSEEREREKVRREFEEEAREKELASQKGLDAKKAAEAKKRRKDLLTKFPPGKWNKDRKEQIMVRMIQGINPTPEEKEFYRVFNEWEKAVKDEEFIKGKKG
ncbi:MAG: hypothetical protein ACYS47_11205 [Planctomycetota bacterium]|jgi:hypothetical protein